MRQALRGLAACAIIALAGLSAGNAHAQARWDQSPRVVFPNVGERGVITYRSGDELRRHPIYWKHAARLLEDITLAFPGEERTLETGAILPLVTFYPTKERVEKEALQLFCTLRSNAGTTFDSGLMGSMFGGLAQRKAARDLSDTQYCLHDADADGMFDHAYLVGEGEGGANFRSYRLDGPVSFEAGEPMETEQDEFERVTFDRLTRRFFRVVFEWRDEEGELQTRRDRFVYEIDDELAELTILGTRARVVSWDRDAGTLTLDWVEDVDPEEENVRPQWR